ncbi:serine hydrolase domain-containing protein [uncultured Microbacterium sp.]|nr:serine hydrolase domain-containing protein [uncultured Microbacterium sp.]
MSDTAGTPAAPPGEIDGFAAASFSVVRDAFARNLASGEELGGSLCVIVDDEVVVDLWGGWSDPAGTVPWGADTITNTWSNSKTVTALAALQLVERGRLDLAAPVARYWPEFAAAGKAHITVRQLLDHTAGVPAWEQPVTVSDILDQDAAADRLAAQEPWFAPGTSQSGYALVCFGHLIGEVVRRIDGRPLGRFVAEELADPLGADFWLGLPESEENRVSLVVPPPRVPRDPASRPEPGSIATRAYSGPILGARDSWTREWRAAGIGGAGGTGNARALARMNQMLAQGGLVEGTRLLSPAVVDAVFAHPTDSTDLVLRLPLRFGLGWALPHPVSTPWLPGDHRIAFWGGWGGSLVICDLDRRMTFAYVMNRMAASVIGSDRSIDYVTRAYAALG